MARRNRRPSYSPPTQRATTPGELAAALTPDLVQAVAAEVVKQLRLPAGATATPVNPMALQQLAMGGYGTGFTRPLAPGGWTDPNVAFGPGVPIRPASIDPLEPATGRPLPRRWEYPVTFNLPGAGERVVPWSVLRQLADNVSIIRRCIEIRKAEMVGLDWDFVVAESVFEKEMLDQAVTRADVAAAKAAAAGDPDAKKDRDKRSPVTRHSIETAARARNAGSIAELRRWWTKPDRIADWTFEEWLTAALEEHFVLDALTLFPHATLGGDLHSVEIIAGDTIKPLLDHRGAVPQPPNPAYQQILHGFPRGEFTATPGEGDEFARDTLIYRPRYRRANSPYGYSNVEQAILDADLYMRRYQWMRAEYTDGVIPELILKANAPLTPDQLYAYERIFNDFLSGNTAERHRAKVIPDGFDPTVMTSVDERYKPDYDEHLIRLIALAFDVMPTELGFPPRGGLGGKGFADSEENVTYRKAIRPTTKWLTGILNEISSTWLRMPEELTFQFLGLEAEDEAAALTSMETLARVAGITINEIRDETGRPRYDVAEADIPLIITQREVIPLEGAIDRANAAATAPPPGMAPQPGQQGQQLGQQGQPGQQPGQQQVTKADVGVSVAGLAVVAADTGRVLMLQRGLDGDDPNGGRWEFPGGHLEAGEEPLAAAKREWQEETGTELPTGQVIGSWVSGPYQGFTYRVDSEDLVRLNPGITRTVLNPDDPDGDLVEVAAWWAPDQLADNTAVRPELAASLPLVLQALAPVTTVAKAAEARAFKRFVENTRRGGRAWRDFQFRAHPSWLGKAANDLGGDGMYDAAVLALEFTLTAA